MKFSSILFERSLMKLAGRDSSDMYAPLPSLSSLFFSSAASSCRSTFLKTPYLRFSCLRGTMIPGFSISLWAPNFRFLVRDELQAALSFEAHGPFGVYNQEMF